MSGGVFQFDVTRRGGLRSKNAEGALDVALNGALSGDELRVSEKCIVVEGKPEAVNFLLDAAKTYFKFVANIGSQRHTMFSICEIVTRSLCRGSKKCLKI